MDNLDNNNNNYNIDNQQGPRQETPVFQQQQQPSQQPRPQQYNQGGGYVWNNGQGPTVNYNPGMGNGPAAARKKGMPGWLKVLLIVLAVIICFVILSVSCARTVNNILNVQPVTEDYIYSDDYIGVLYLDGTISAGNSGDGYNQKWMLKRIEQMAKDDLNKGMVMYINTPGGSAYATAELYKALLEYKEDGKPIYVYMANQATSGGYYAAMAADKIYANEECWTGSIGVIISGLFDFSELLETYGVKVENITSGNNKDMGNQYKPLTDDQRAIFQSLVDDTFDRFVAAVVKGRNMSEAKVRELADGRIYTANQALDNGLIDEIGTLDGTIDAMKEDFDLKDVTSHTIQYVEQVDLFGYLGFDGLSDINKSDLTIIKEILDEAESFEIQCIAPRKGE